MSGALGPVWILPGGQQTVLRNVVFAVPSGTQSLFEISVTFTHANQAPAIASLADQSSLEGDAVSLTLDASDPEGDPLSWSASGLPAGLSLSIAGGTATVVGTIASGAGGVYTPHINASDAAFTASTSFTWTVDNTPAGPGSLVTLPGASIAFAGVSTPGLTTLTTSTTLPPIPDGFQTGNPPVFFDLTTTATFSSAVVRVGYAPSAFRDPGTLRMLHYELNAWRDVTLSLDQVAHQICGSVTAFSPFVVVEPLNRAPVAVAGPDRVLEATSPAGAMITLDGSASSDPDADPLTYTWIGRFGTATGAAPVVTLPLGSNTITLTVQDGRGGTATATVVAVVRDTIAPTVAIASPAGVTYLFEQAVAASYSCADSGSGVASCTGPVPSGSPIDTSSEGDHTFAVTAQDVAGNTATTTVTYTVTGVEGRMEGGGEIRTPDGREHTFEFRIAERRVGLERGALHYRVKTPKAGKQKERADRFESTSIGSIVFWDDPAFRAGRGPKPIVDSAIFTGTGEWNGAGGFTFEARAADEGEPGRGRDTFAITIRDARGTVVATVGGTLTAGNIQSSRLPDRHKAGETRR